MLEDQGDETDLQQDLETTRALHQTRIRQRKHERRKKALSAALVVLCITLVVCAAGLLVRYFILEPALNPKPIEEAVQEVQQEPSQEEAEPVSEEEPQTQEEPEPEQVAEETETETEIDTDTARGKIRPTEDTLELDTVLFSGSAVLIDAESGEILAQKNADTRIYPASMTKIMAALVASEHITDWSKTFRMTQEIIDPLYLADATMAGFLAGEDVSLESLLYGAILPSGAEATEALAIEVAGSEEAFVELMNEKAAELGLADTHFVDASGLHDENHYTTVSDMACILQAAMENEMCRNVLTAREYTSQPTEQNPDGVYMLNKFLVRVDGRNQDGAEIQGAKTGYTAQAMNCCASFGQTPSGKEVICVTALGQTGEYCISDQIALYSYYNNEG